jgi:hypothetical protein
LSGDGKTATFDLDDRKISLTNSFGTITISDCDHVLVAGRIGDPCHSSLYFNETTGAGSVESTYKASRSLLIVGLMLGLAAIAIFLVVAQSALGELRLFSRTVLWHLMLGSAAIFAAAAMLYFSFAVMAVGAHMRMTSRLLGSVVNAPRKAGANGSVH